ncbi:MAG: hypothetical protein M3063_07885 [Actinomycetota bacterium]|nr:hypothetical protein [Actinomycetota bacterium]
MAERSSALAAFAFDSQTSGGLLAAVAPGDADHGVADNGFTLIGAVADGAVALTRR